MCFYPACAPIPHLFLTHSATGEIVLDLAYGIDVKGTDDPFIQLAEAANQGAVATGTPGAFLVDVIPFCECQLAPWSDVNSFT